MPIDAAGTTPEPLTPAPETPAVSTEVAAADVTTAAEPTVAPVPTPLAEGAVSGEAVVAAAPTGAKAELPADLRPITPEADKTPESAERIEKVRAALAEIVAQAADMSRPHPRAEGNASLRQIDLLTYVGEDKAYRLGLGYSTDSLDDNFMLTLETPNSRPAWDRGDVVALGEAGVSVEGRKIQDFLYVKGATAVPVREVDFTYVYDYRPTGSSYNYDAAKPQVDQLLGFLVGANVATKDNRTGSFVKGAKLVEMVPAVAELKAA
ncbi:hypothetical protein HJC99_00605 [Candidatus Saccharibacteria bacterium]|nr:hypothetical protein [Candidatus Saccharibacteria bacterium]